jgi:uncharacterized protein YybS (DUF2232 family)
LGDCLLKRSMKAKDVLGCVGTTTVLLLSSAYIPLAGSLFSLITPLPILYYSTKLGLDQGVKLVGITVLFVGLLAAMTRTIHLLFMSIEFSLMGLIVSELFRKNLSIGYTVLLGTGVMLLIGFVVLAIAGLSRNKTPMEVVLAYLQGSLDYTVLVYQGTGGGEVNPLRARQYVQLLTHILMKIYPALTTVGTGFVVWFNVVVSKPLFRAGKLQYPQFGPMDRWAAPEHLIWGVIAAGFCLFLPVSQIRFVAVNVMIVLLAVYFFHGLSILLFFLSKYRVPLWIRLGVYALIVFQQIFAIVIVGAGLFDQWVDFRRIRPRKIM